MGAKPAETEIAGKCTGQQADQIEDQDAFPVENATSDEVFDAVYVRLGRDQRVPDQRVFDRRQWVTNLTIWVESELNTESNPRPLRVTTQDISRGGFSFISKRFLFPGATIRTRFDVLPQRPVIRGVVRNCSHVGAGQHRVGVQFISPEEDPPEGESDVSTEHASGNRTRSVPEPDRSRQNTLF